jgi:hypothetical protein
VPPPLLPPSSQANLYHAAPHLFVYALSGAAMVRAVLDILENERYLSLPGAPTQLNTDLLYFSMMWTIFLWVMVSGPPRMLLYGWCRARREARSALKCTNNNVPALQELPTTPMNTFPPLSPELWAKASAAAWHADWRRFRCRTSLA